MARYRMLLALSLLAVPGCGACASHRPQIVSARQWGSRPLPIPESRAQTPRFVTLHHAGELWTGKVRPEEFIRRMQKWGQAEKGWPDLPYHFLIAPDGRIFEGRPVTYEPESNTNYPLSGNVGVEMMGDFEKQRPDPRQLRSAALLTAWLMGEYAIPESSVRGHKDAAPGQTDCPGTDFYRYLLDGAFLSWVRAVRNGEDVRPEPGPALPGGPTAPIPAD